MTDAPDLSRAALEVLAERLEAVDHMSVEDCFLQSPLYWRAAATLRALSARVIELEEQNARLKKALETIASHGNHDNGHCGCHQNTFINIARAALETSNAD